MPKEVYPNLPGAGYEEVFEEHSYWPLCYPRIYNNVSQFATPKKVAYDLATILWDHTVYMKRKPSPGGQDQFEPAVIGAASYHAARLAKLRVPMFFVERDLLLALTKTTPPEAIDWKALALPFDAAAFIFANKALTVPGAGDIDFVWYSRAFADQPVRIPSGVPHELALPTSQFYIRTVLGDAMESPAIIHQINDDTDPTIDLSKSLDIDLMPGSSAISDAERTVAAIISGLVFNLILAMDARPELLTHGSTKGKRSKRGSEFWHPNIIGKQYRVVGSGRESGSGITHRMHWRRGHWRNQAHGAGYAQRKNLWIEPTLVAAP